MTHLVDVIIRPGGDWRLVVRVPGTVYWLAKFRGAWLWALARKRFDASTGLYEYALV